MTEKRAHPHTEGIRLRDELKAKVFYGWDVYSLVVLSIVLTGLIPLAVATGIAVGFAVSQFLTWWKAALIGFVSLLATGAMQWLVLWAFTRDRVRQWFIPWARRWFP